MSESEDTGSSLRQKLEEALAEKQALKAKLAEATIKDFKYVKPEDLADVSVDELAAKAAELQKEREAERQSAVRDFFEEKGVASEQLDQMLQSFTADSNGASNEALERIAALGGVSGTPHRTPTGADAEPGPSRMKAALAAKSKS